MMFTSPHKPSKNLADELAAIITKAGTWTPRSKQTAIGPSEVGHPCTRRLAYKLTGADKVNEISSSTWSAQVGTAIHAYLADVFGGIEGYEVEQKVYITDTLAGTIDLYDGARGIVMDWKTTGSSGLSQRKREGATDQQLVQTMLYAYGKAKSGANVTQVALVYLPTSGDINDMHVALYDYDENIALGALSRLAAVHALTDGLDLPNNPQMWAMVPKVADRLCSYCPYFKPYSTDLSKGCNGESES
jgi:hypothetical protein